MTDCYLALSTLVSYRSLFELENDSQIGELQDSRANCDSDLRPTEGKELQLHFPQPDAQTVGGQLMIL